MTIRRLASVLLGTALLASSFAYAHAQTVKVKVGEVLRSQFYTPMYVALGKGFAKEEGLDIELITANGSDRVGALVLSDGVDIGLAGPEVPMYIYNGESSDKPLIFCALTGSDGMVLVSKAKIDKFEWSMLNGKRIMGQRPGSTPQLSFEYVLKEKGVDAATIKSVVTNVGPAARDGAWIAGGFDFGIFFEPSLTKLEKAGAFQVIVPLGREVGRVEFTSFFAKKSWLAKNGEIAQKWTNAIQKAQTWMRTASAKDVAEAITTYFPGISIDEHVDVINRFRGAGAPIWSDTSEVDRGGIVKLQEMMVIGGVLPADKKVAYDVIVTTDYSNNARQRLAKQN